LVKKNQLLYPEFMKRTYDLPRRVVKGMPAYLVRVNGFARMISRAILCLLLLATPAIGLAQGLPSFAPLNPVASSRSGVYFQSLRDPAPRQWSTSITLDYASIIEYNRLDQAD